jgi:1-deoxy-D-xylulose-5-phosphate reductoisomerase
MALLQRLGPTGSTVEVVCDTEGPEVVANHPGAQIVLTAMVGARGLAPTLAAIRRGVRVAVANKEPLVMAGQLCTEEARRSGAQLLPVDSEHSAIHQCLQGQAPGAVRRLLLTGSGGPLRHVGDLSTVTVEQALAHPTWSMGPKITIDSATLMNKGLEVIEARWLFDVPEDSIEVVIHPESIIHSMIELVDGSVLAQLGRPDMRLPIAYALGYPDRLPLPEPPLDLAVLGALSFEPPDRKRFPCLELAYRALKAGAAMPAILNAANEVAVKAFLDGRIGLEAIPRIIAHAMQDEAAGEFGVDLDSLLAADSWARQHAATHVLGQ